MIKTHQPKQNRRRYGVYLKKNWIIVKMIQILKTKCNYR